MYWIRLRISDHTTPTTCSIFDDDAKKEFSRKLLQSCLNHSMENLKKFLKL